MVAIGIMLRSCYTNFVRKLRAEASQARISKWKPEIWPETAIADYPGLPKRHLEDKIVCSGSDGRSIVAFLAVQQHDARRRAS